MRDRAAPVTATAPVAPRRLRDVTHTAAGTRGGTVGRMLPAADDEALARAAVAGDGAAFAQLYDRHERRAFNLAYRITGTREDAADATQEAFVKLLARLPRMAGRKLDFGSYLLTAVRHSSYDVLAAVRRADPTGDVPDSARPVGAAARPPPEEDPRLVDRLRGHPHLRLVGELAAQPAGDLLPVLRSPREPKPRSSRQITEPVLRDTRCPVAAGLRPRASGAVGCAGGGSAVEMVGGGMLPGMRRPWAHGPASSMSSRRRYSYMMTSGRGLSAMTPFGVKRFVSSW